MIDRRAINIPEAGTDYRARLIHQIILCVVGPVAIFQKDNSIYFVGTEEDQQQVQALIDECIPELDYIIEQAFLSYLHDHDLCTEEPIQLTLLSA